MNLELQDRSVLVTGGASGIGAACVRGFATEGAKVAIVDQDRKRAEALAGELTGVGACVVCIAADLTEESACREAVAAAQQALGPLEILINNAGVNDSVGLDRPPAEFLESLRRNLLHVYAVTHFARDALIKARGSIVNIGSKVAVTGQGGTSGYAAAKGGILALTREWALALAPFGVRANCVVPAECDTPLYQRWFNGQSDPAAARAAIEHLVPLGHRLTTPAEVAAAILFLASPCASHITGQILFVDGGYTHLDRAATHPHRKWA
jgi:NAD(P)-dependent dehydrogenase (short-subunit alcohol dehydrogenase family)